MERRAAEDRQREEKIDRREETRGRLLNIVIVVIILSGYSINFKEREQRMSKVYFSCILSYPLLIHINCILALYLYSSFAVFV